LFAVAKAPRRGAMTQVPNLERRKLKMAFGSRKGESDERSLWRRSKLLLDVALLTILASSVGVWLPWMEPARAAFPGVNGKIAFMSDRDGDCEIWVVNADGSGLTQLTFNSAFDAEPVWSPDGKKIAFTSDRGGYWGIWTMNADGSGQTQLTTSLGTDCGPAWSPDGSKIVFTRFYNPPVNDGEIWVMNADGSGQTQLTFNAVLDCNPCWSPDGSKIAFVESSENTGGPTNSAEIFVMNPDGSGKTRLTFNSMIDGAPDWSPDGSKITFYRDISWMNSDIWVMNADGSGQTQLTFSTQHEGRPAWSPDGSKIVFDKGSTSSQYHNIFTMNPDGSGQNPLTFSTGTPLGDWIPDWQPVSPVIEVTIDIKPGTYPNSINLKDQGLLPVAILGSAAFDVSTVDETTLQLGGVGIATRGKAGKTAFSIEDVNGDGYLDLVAFFKVQDLVAAGALDASTTELVLTGSLKDGTAITGKDSVRIVPP